MKKILKRLYYRLHSNYTTEDLIKIGLKVGKNFKRMHGVILDPSHCWLISIGDNVTIAPNVHILAHDASLKFHIGYTRIGNVIIGNNVFIGAESVILPNVHIGDNVIIGANSTVSRSIPSGMVAIGSPAKVLCTTQEFIDRAKKQLKERPCYGEEFTLRKNITKERKEQMFKELQNG